MWEDSVGTLTENRAYGLVHFNLKHTTCIRYISCICNYLGNFVFELGCFFVFLFYCWILSMFVSLFDVSFFLSFLMGKGFWCKREWNLNQKTIIKLLFFISVNINKNTVIFEHDKLAFDQRDITNWWKGVLDDNYWQFFLEPTPVYWSLYLFDLTKAQRQNERKKQNITTIK